MSRRSQLLCGVSRLPRPAEPPFALVEAMARLIVNTPPSHAMGIVRGSDRGDRIEIEDPHA